MFAPTPTPFAKAEDTFALDLNGQSWSGQYACPFKQYKAQFPAADQAKRLTVESYLSSAVIRTAVEYDAQLTACIVMSSIPAGRSAMEELHIQLQKSQALLARLELNTLVEQASYGNVPIALRFNLENAAPTSASGNFPLSEGYWQTEGPALSVSAHRIFVFNGSRMEVAVLQTLPPQWAANEEDEIAMCANVNGVADHLLTSLLPF